MSQTVYEKSGDVLRVRPGGRLDTATSPVLEKELHGYLDGVRDIVMDFADVEYISSGGLRVLLAVEQLMEDRGGCLRLTHVNANIIEIFELVGFMDVVRVDRD